MALRAVDGEARAGENPTRRGYGGVVRDAEQPAAQDVHYSTASRTRSKRPEAQILDIPTLNSLDQEAARQAFSRCCGARAWVATMLAERPFADRAALLAASERGCARLTREDWLEAFAHHPRIGDVASLRERFASTARWAGDEQRGATGADEPVLHALARGNDAYHQRFGYIFIVCATGKSAGEMLAILESRLPNDPARELEIAAREQAQITRLRLDKLLEDA